MKRTKQQHTFDEFRDRHPYLVRAEGLGVGLFPDDIRRWHSNERIAISTANMYRGDAARYGKPYFVRIDYWNGREWALLEEWHS